MGSDRFFINDREIDNRSDVPEALKRAYQWGEGLIETMLFENGEIKYLNHHIERLESGIKTLKFPENTINTALLISNLTEVTKQAFHEDSYVVRLQVFLTQEKEGGYSISTMPFAGNKIKEPDETFVVGVCEEVLKCADGTAHLKSTSRLNYLMAAQMAKDQNWDDALLLNQHGRVVESTIANIFRVKDKKIYTPPLSEGCVAGVFRSVLLNHPALTSFSFIEKPVSIDELLRADELFLTNSIKGIQTVSRFKNRIYSSKLTNELKEAMLRTES